MKFSPIYAKTVYFQRYERKKHRVLSKFAQKLTDSTVLFCFNVFGFDFLHISLNFPPKCITAIGHLMLRTEQNNKDHIQISKSIKTVNNGVIVVKHNSHLVRSLHRYDFCIHYKTVQYSSIQFIVLSFDQLKLGNGAVSNSIKNEENTSWNAPTAKTQLPNTNARLPCGNASNQHGNP